MHGDANGVWWGHLGDFVPLEELAHWWGADPEDVESLVAARQILTVPTQDERVVVPTFQFDTDRRPLPHLPEVLNGLDPDDRDPWGAALWLATPSKWFEGRAPCDVLRDHDWARVLHEARLTGASVWGP